MPETSLPTDAASARNPLAIAATVGLLALFTIVLVRTAWLSDDAYITFRTIDNWQHGYGLRWNPLERVQSYTHPLWMLAIALATRVSGEFFATAIVVSIGISLAAVALLALRTARSHFGAALVVGIALGSKALVDFSTSGLENPLTHLLLVLFATACVSDDRDRSLRGMCIWAGLAALNRLDVVLLLAPALVWTATTPIRAAAARWLAVGFLPLLGWELFSIVYYGFPFPNTAYAKLGAGLDAGELIRQGLHYLENAVRWDPITPIAIVWGCAAALIRGEPRERALALGVVGYLVYVVCIGGDFMSGRFLSAPLVVGLALIARRDYSAPSSRGLAVGVAVAGALLCPQPPLLSGAGYGLDHDEIEWDRGIDDERRWYFQWSGWLRATDPRPEPINDHALRGMRLRRDAPATARYGVVGFLGFNAGPQVHIVDSLALNDPLLARLPAYHDSDWRIGHFKRLVPRGYMKTLMTGENRIRDPNLAAYYAALETVTRAPLFAPERWRAIWQLNRGALDHLIDADAYRDPRSGLAVRP